jgi:sugar phosphate isomerase/epimerase
MKITMHSRAWPMRFPASERFAAIRNAGFEAIDWATYEAWPYDAIIAAENPEDLCDYDKTVDELRAHYAEELEAIRAAGLTVDQIHAPAILKSFGGRPAVMRYLHRVYENFILYCEEIGCQRMVVHGICMYRNDPIEWTGKDILALNRDLFRGMIPALKKTSVIVCIENIFSYVKQRDYLQGFATDPNELAAFLDALNEEVGREAFGVCLDTGHMNLMRMDPRTFLSILGKRVQALHLHDNNQSTDSHDFPYYGAVDWPAVLRGLREAGYRGPLSFETFPDPAVYPLELIPVYLNALAKTGDCFRIQLLGS